MTDFPWPFSLIQDWLEALWNLIAETPWKASRWLRDRIFLRLDVKTSELRSWTADLYRRLLDYGRSLHDSLANILRAEARDLRGLTRRLHDSLAGLVKDARSELTRAIAGGIGELREHVGSVQAVLSSEHSSIRELTSHLVGDALSSVMSGLRDLAGKAEELAGNVVERVGTMFDGALAPIPDALRHVLDPLLSGIEGWEPASFVGEVQDIIARYTPELEAIIEEASPMTPEEARERMRRLQVITNAVGAALLAASAVLTYVTKGMGGGSVYAVFAMPWVRQWWDMVSEAKRTAAQASFLIPLRYYFYNKHRPLIPRDDQAIELYIKGLIGEDEFRRIMGYRGWADEWHETLLRNAYRAPTISEATEMLWRGLIDEGKFREILRFNLLPPEFHDHYLALTERIPGPSDLIRFVVREVIKPEDFTKFMAQQGYKKFWADAYWEAHWVLPSISDLRDAFWRGLISEEEFRRYIVWHDYKPEPRPGISISDTDLELALMWELPTKIDARWMYRWGLIGREELLELARARGVHPEWREKVVDAWIRNEYMDDVNRIISKLKRQYALGILSDEEFKSAITALGKRPEEAEFLLQEAKADAVIDFYEAVEKELVEALEEGRIDEPTFRGTASNYGIQAWKQDDIIALARLKRALRAGGE